MNLEEIIQNSTVSVADGRYGVVKLPPSHRVEGEYFLVSRDADETTVIAEERNFQPFDGMESQKWFTLVGITVATAFTAPGFLARIMEPIAAQKIDLLVVSTYSKDYLLVREADANAVLSTLRGLGFMME